MTTPSETRPYDGGREAWTAGNVGPIAHAQHGSVVRMSDRPGNGGPEDGPDYTWLYGRGGKPPRTRRPPARSRASSARPRPRPDETRVMQAQPRTRTQRRDRPGRPRRRWRRRSSRRTGERPAGGRRFRVRYVFIVLLLWLAYLVIVPVMAWHDVDKVDWEPDGDRPADQPGTTYLLVGSDSRAGLSKEERKELSTGNAAGGRTDTIMLLHTGSGPNLLLSIPRDSIVDIPGHGTTKINAAYAFGGPRSSCRPSSRTPAIRIDDYVEIGMGGVAGLVDAVGGIEVCPKQNMKDKLAGLDIKKGCQDVDGTTALAYARSRHASATGDIDRVRRQREVVAAVGKAVLSPWSILNPVRYWKLNHEIPDFFAFGDGMGPVRSAHVGDRDDPGRRRQGADLRGAAAGPRGALGPREGAADVQEDHRGRHRVDRRRPLLRHRRHRSDASPLYETLSVSVDEDGVATLTLDRPGQLNAFDLTMARELERFFLTDARSDDVRAVVVTGRRARVLRRHGPLARRATCSGSTSRWRRRRRSSGRTTTSRPSTTGCATPAAA